MIKKIVIVVVVSISLFACKQEKRFHEDDHSEVIATEEIAFDFDADVQKFQNELNKEYSDPDTSPLYDRHRARFEGLDFFEANENYRVEARLVVTPSTTPFMMPTTNNKVEKEERVYGILEFELFSKPYRLEVYQSTDLMNTKEYADYLFLPFTDLTNGEETYGGGRYMDLRIPKSNRIIIDFNKSYNPFCAYNVNYACPKVPKVNHLAIAIKAGVKKFHE